MSTAMKLASAAGVLVVLCSLGQRLEGEDFG